MSDRELLLKHGWHEHSRKRGGCVIQVWWYKPGDKTAVKQAHAAAIVRDELRRIKSQRKAVQ